MRINVPFKLDKNIADSYRIIMRRELELLISKFLAVNGWERTEKKSLIIYNKHSHLMLSFSHKVLTYIEEQQKRVPWVELRLLAKKELTQSDLDTFIAELVRLQLCPFIDNNQSFTSI